MESTIRDARPQDKDFLAWVMLTAARSHLPLSSWDYAFPGPEAPRLETLADLTLAEPTNFANYNGFLVAESDGRAIGALSGYDSANKPFPNFSMALGAVLDARKWSGKHIELLMQRIAPTISCMPDSPEGVWVIEWVALKPEARGKGIAHRLLEAVLERGRERGYTDAQISVITGNTAAQSAYEGVGFKAIENLTDPGFEAALGAPGITRMARKL